MGWRLLWAEMLSAGLLLVALAAACSGRMSRRWLRVGVPVMTALVPGLVGLWAVWLAAILNAHERALAFDRVLRYGVWWEGAFLLGAALVVTAGLRRSSALSWPRGRLLLWTVVTAVLGLTTIWNMDMAAESRLKAARGEAGVQALSLTTSRPPAPQNAALVYRQAFGLIGKETEIPEFPPGGDNSAARAFVREHETALGLLRRASAMPGCYFGPVLAETDVQALMPDLLQMRQGAKLLALDARVQAADGRAGAALRDVEAGSDMARHTGENSSLFQTEVAAAIVAITDSALQTVLGTLPSHPR